MRIQSAHTALGVWEICDGDGMKRICSNCRALRGLGLDQRCSLGYKIRLVTIKTDDYKLERAVPDEACPKPLTWEQYGKADRK